MLVQQDAGNIILLCVLSFLDLGHSLLANVRINGVQGSFFFFLLLFVFFLFVLKPYHLTS